MTINSFLCKYLDSGKKGYVTIGDIFFSILVLIFASMILFVLGSATSIAIYRLIVIYRLFPEYWYINGCLSYVCGNMELIVSALIGLGIDALILIAILVQISIFEVKIAKCERR